MSSRRAAAAESNEQTIWQEVEFGSYDADLPLWLELARSADEPVLELGAGAGRVALHLAEQGIRVLALEREPELIAELERRAADLDTLRVVPADLAQTAEIRLPEEPGLMIAPLHVLQTLDPAARLALLGGLRDLVSPGAILAAALVDESTLLSAGAAATQILPDMREVERWVYSSEPLWVQVGAERLKVRRIRERVSPEGERERVVHDELLHRISPDRLQLEAEDAGFSSSGVRAVRSGAGEADSVVVLLEAV
jgi:SAM-dependent methyltransferase